MHVPLAVIADYANTTATNKLNIMGIFDRIQAASVPAMHPQMQLVFVLEADPTERGAQKAVEVILMDQDGKQLITMGTELAVPAEGPLVQRFHQMIQLNGIVFPGFGTYSFIIKVNGEQKASVSFTVAPPPNQVPPATK